MQKTKFLIFSLLLIPLLSACSLSFNTGDANSPAESDLGGVFKSINKGSSWKQKTSIASVGGSQRNFGGTSVNSFVMDPSDNKALYYGSAANGLAFSYDGAESWQLAQKLGAINITDIAIDPSNKCRIYTAVGNKVFRSEDCSRTWKQVYIDNQPNVAVKAIAIDHFDSSRVFIGLGRGDLVRSLDYGESWKTVHRFNGVIKDVLIDPKDSRKMFTVTERRGLFRSLDGGENWINLGDTMSEFSIGNNIRDMIILNTDPTMIFLAGVNGLIKSDNDGSSWQKLELITPDKRSQINSVAVNPNNTDEIYYVTNTTFYKSADGGVSWTPQKLPTVRAGWKLLIDPDNPNIIYMAIKSLQR